MSIVKRWLTDPDLSDDQIRQEINDYVGSFDSIVANQITAETLWVDKAD